MALLKFVRVVGVTWLLTLVLLVLGESPASACSCAGGRSVTEAVREADAVFIGDVISAEAESEGFQTHGPDMVFTFEVAEKRKGSVGDRQEVLSPGGAVCGVSFEVGRRYVVYARTVGAATGPTDRLITHLCAGPDNSGAVAVGPIPEPSPVGPRPSGDASVSLAALGGVALLSAATATALVVVAGRT